jgi:hypothetical protein
MTMCLLNSYIKQLVYYISSSSLSRSSSSQADGGWMDGVVLRWYLRRREECRSVACAVLTTWAKQRLPSLRDRRDRREKERQEQERRGALMREIREARDQNQCNNNHRRWPLRTVTVAVSEPPSHQPEAKEEEEDLVMGVKEEEGDDDDDNAAMLYEEEAEAEEEEAQSTFSTVEVVSLPPSLADAALVELLGSCVLVQSGPYPELTKRLNNLMTGGAAAAVSASEEEEGESRTAQHQDAARLLLHAMARRIQRAVRNKQR